MGQAVHVPYMFLQIELQISQLATYRIGALIQNPNFTCGMALHMLALTILSFRLVHDELIPLRNPRTYDKCVTTH